MRLTTLWKNVLGELECDESTHVLMAFACVYPEPLPSEGCVIRCDENTWRILPKDYECVTLKVIFIFRRTGYSLSLQILGALDGSLLEVSELTRFDDNFEMPILKSKAWNLVC